MDVQCVGNFQVFGDRNYEGLNNDDLIPYRRILIEATRNWSRKNLRSDLRTKTATLY